MDTSVKTEVDDEIYSLKEELLSRLYQRRQQFVIAIEKIDLAIKSFHSFDTQSQASIVDNIGNLNVPSIAITESEITKLKDATWAELFMWGLARCGNEASVSQIAKELSKLPFESIQERIAKKTLYQVLDVQAKALHRKEYKIDKIKNKQRKGGFLYRLKKNTSV